MTGVTYRNPSVFAAEAVTIDHASNGRLELSLGAAWFDEEHHELGIPFPATPTRFDLLEDTLEIVQRLFTGEVVSYEGKVVSLKDARVLPTPVQQPRPPIWIGGSGPKRTLPLVAKYADVWHTWGSPNSLAEANARVDELAVEAGRDPGDITRASSLSLDDLDTARKHAGEVARHRLRLPRLRLARRRPRPDRGLRPRRDAGVHRLNRNRGNHGGGGSGRGSSAAEPMLEPEILTRGDRFSYWHPKPTLERRNPGPEWRGWSEPAPFGHGGWRDQPERHRRVRHVDPGPRCCRGFSCSSYGAE